MSFHSFLIINPNTIYQLHNKAFLDFVGQPGFLFLLNGRALAAAGMSNSFCLKAILTICLHIRFKKYWTFTF